MVLRLTADDLETLRPEVREQVAPHLTGADRVPANCVPQRRATNRPEEDIGRALTAWIDLLVLPNGLRPGLFWFHVPNGLARTAAQGGIFKAQGLRKGWPDYGLALPLGPYHGFWQEIKSDNGAKPSVDQLDILHRLEAVGNKCCVAWGFDQAASQISEYLDLAR